MLEWEFRMVRSQAWMVFEHNKHEFPTDWLPKIFALATFGAAPCTHK
jgi:hypothetical protein